MLKRKIAQFALVGTAVLALAACNNNDNDNGALSRDGNGNNVRPYGIDRTLNRNDLGINQDMLGDRTLGTNQSQGRRDGTLYTRSYNNNGTHGTDRRTVDRARANTDRYWMKDDRLNSNMDGRNRDNGTTTGRLNENSRMERADDVAERLTSLQGVDSANVMLTDNNAYVAVKLDDDDQNNNTGGRRGSAMNRMNTNEDNDMTDSLKRQIADQVRQMEPGIDNVYVSANPDFADRLGGFMDQLNNGHPVRGLMDELNEMIDRIFPDNAADDNRGMLRGTNR